MGRKPKDKDVVPTSFWRLPAARKQLVASVTKGARVQLLRLRVLDLLRTYRRRITLQDDQFRKYSDLLHEGSHVGILELDDRSIRIRPIHP